MSLIEGEERVKNECGVCACVLNFSLIGMHKEKVCGIYMHT